MGIKMIKVVKSVSIFIGVDILFLPRFIFLFLVLHFLDILLLFFLHLCLFFPFFLILYLIFVISVLQKLIEP